MPRNEAKLSLENRGDTEHPFGFIYSANGERRCSYASNVKDRNSSDPEKLVSFLGQGGNWIPLTPHERLVALEMLRKQYPGFDWRESNSLR